MNLFGQMLSLAEIAGTVTGLIAVWLTVKQNRWCFPIGIVSCFIYAMVFFSDDVRYYADASLQLIYIVLLGYGWMHWNDKTVPVVVTRANKKLLVTSAISIALGTLVIGTVFQTSTQASLPYIDALTTSMSLVAQWMVARKKIENWSLWIAANVIYIAMYIHKDLHVTAVYYGILLLLAFSGWNTWRKQLEK